MQYEKDKRPKNLSLRDIYVGDWVTVWSEEEQTFLPPLKITAIYGDGTIEAKGLSEQLVSFWFEIKDVYALPITPELLRGFGFELKKIIYPGEYSVYYNKKKICSLWKNGDDFDRFCQWKSGAVFNFYKWSHTYNYFHEFLQRLDNEVPIDKIEWKGKEKTDNYIQVGQYCIYYDKR